MPFGDFQMNRLYSSLEELEKQQGINVQLFVVETAENLYRENSIMKKQSKFHFFFMTLSVRLVAQLEQKA